MIIQPQLPGGYVTFCDDIRDEASGKQMFIGVYSGEMTIWGKPPINLPQLCILISFRHDPNTFPLDMTFRVSQKGRETKTIWEAVVSMAAPPPDMFKPSPEPDSVRFAEVRAVPKFVGLEISEECRISVSGLVGDNEYRLGSLSIKFGEPPAEQADA